MIFIAWLAGVSFIVAIVLGVEWLFWSLWCWVLPQLWPTGPIGLIAPGYWLFVGALLILGIVGRTMRGGKE